MRYFAFQYCVLQICTIGNVLLYFETVFLRVKVIYRISSYFKKSLEDIRIEHLIHFLTLNI